MKALFNNLKVKSSLNFKINYNTQTNCVMHKYDNVDIRKKISTMF